MGHIKINRINLVFKISVSIGDNTNVMQKVDPDEQFKDTPEETGWLRLTWRIS